MEGKRAFQAFCVHTLRLTGPVFYRGPCNGSKKCVFKENVPSFLFSGVRLHRARAPHAARGQDPGRRVLERHLGAAAGRRQRLRQVLLPQGRRERQQGLRGGAQPQGESEMPTIIVKCTCAFLQNFMTDLFFRKEFSMRIGLILLCRLSAINLRTVRLEFTVQVLFSFICYRNWG